MDWNKAFRRRIFGPPLRLLFPMNIVGLENLPAEGPYLIAIGPHTTFLETLVFPVSFQDIRIRQLAKGEIWDKGRPAAWFMDAVGAVRVDRDNRASGAAAIEAMTAVLRNGEIGVTYPEGTRNRDGYLHHLRYGTAVMAIRAQVPIVPIALLGMENLNPSGVKLRPGPCTAIVGEPIHPMTLLGQHEGLMGRAIENTLKVIVTDRLTKELLSLSHRKLAPKKSDGLPAA